MSQSVLDKGNYQFYYSYMNKYQKNIILCRDILGSYDAVGHVCGGITGKAVIKWKNKGRPPRTEYTGETNYAELIQVATNNEVSKHDLLPKLI